MTETAYNNMTYNGGSSKEGGFFTTFTGVKFNAINPDISMINIWDIAHSLSMICRFGGHSRYFYSVAQHSVLISELCGNGIEGMQGLLHDATEAYIGDMVRPLKYTDAMVPFRDLENKLEEIICKRFGLPFPMSPVIKDWDNAMVVKEAGFLFIPTPQWVLDAREHISRPLLNKIVLTDLWEPEVAEGKFLGRFTELLGSNY